MPGTRAIGAVIACAWAVVGCATWRAPAPGTGDAAVAREDVVTATATVEDIDVESRIVTLRDPEGNTTTLRVDDSVRNLAQVRRDDAVVVQYREAMVVRVKKPGEVTPGVTESAEPTRAAPGEKPGGTLANTATIVVTVDAIDRANRSVVLVGPKGNKATVDVRDPASLEKIAVGDLLEITVTEAVAVDVRPAPTR
jgi:hypothetical protein